MADVRLPENVEKALKALVDYTDLEYDPGVEPLRRAVAAALLRAEAAGIKHRCDKAGCSRAHELETQAAALEAGEK